MLLTLLSIWLITVVCYSWGILFFNPEKQGAQSLLSHPAIQALAGLMMISLAATLISLFLPLGASWVKCLFLLPLIILLFQKRGLALLNPFISVFQGFTRGAWFLFLSLLLMVLVLSAPVIIHPDTLGYHAPVIRWIEEYRVVPGLAHLQPRMGLQNSWFVSIALFDWPPKTGSGILFLPATVLVWYFLFMTDKIQSSLRDKNYPSMIGWMAWLLISLGPITMARLTAMSTHPDFMAVLVCWVVFLLMLNRKNENEYRVHTLIFLFSIYAITIKLSVVPILLIGGYAKIVLLRSNIWRSLVPLFLAMLLLAGMMTRLFISTGYPLYPSTFLGWAEPEWKMESQQINDMGRYVTGYARGYHSENYTEVMAGSGARLNDWLPRWWGYLSMADKLMMALTLLSLVVSMVRFGRKEYRRKVGWLLLVSLAGLTFWWIKAPDPRFGYAFTTGIMLAAWWKIDPILKIKWSPLLSGLFIWLLAATIILYIGWCLRNGDIRHYLITPGGPPAEKLFNLINKDGRDVIKPNSSKPCGWSILPCTPDSVEHWEFRGEGLQSGFRQKE